MAVSVRKSAPGREAAPAPARHRRAARSRRRLRERATITAFLLPALVLFAALVLLPVVFALYTSLFRWGGFGWPEEFVGLDNFVRLFQDEVFLGDLWRGFVLIALSVGVQLPFALAMAVLLNQRLRGRAFYRLLFFAPYVLSEVITGVLFTMIFAPDSGLADHIMDAVGLGGLGITWFASSSTVLPTVFLVMTWKYFGFHMILYLAGLQSIPKDVLEAASIDGAGAWQRFRHVTLPLLMPTVIVAILLRGIDALKTFDILYATKGKGGGAFHDVETLNVYAYGLSFDYNEYGISSTVLILFFLIIIGSMWALTARRKEAKR